MNYDRLATAMRIAPLLTGLVLFVVFYRKGMPVPSPAKRAVFGLLGLAFIFGPILIGNYLAGRRGKPPLS